MSLISRPAISLALLALAGTAASAQAPSALYPPPHHRMKAPAVPAVSLPGLVSGRSYVSLPRSGTEPFVTAGDFRQITGLSAGLDLWATTGPAPLLNGGGAFGSPVGQNTSGRIVGIAADPTNNNTYYMAPAGGGVWKTTDGGQTYTALTDFLGDTAMGSIVIAPSNHNVIYAGTGEANYAGDSRYGIGLLRSTDGGNSWSVIPGPARQIARTAFSTAKQSRGSW